MYAPIQAKQPVATCSRFGRSPSSPGFVWEWLVRRVAGSCHILKINISTRNTMSTLHFSPLMSPSDSRFLRALIWARWSVFMVKNQTAQSRSKWWTTGLEKVLLLFPHRLSASLKKAPIRVFKVCRLFLSEKAEGCTLF